MCVGVTQKPSRRSRLAIAWPEYVAQFEELEQSLRQHVAADVLRLYALLDAESDFIREWVAKEEVQCAALRRQTKLLYRFKYVADATRHHPRSMPNAVCAVCSRCSWKTRRLGRFGCAACRWRTPSDGVA